MAEKRPSFLDILRNMKPLERPPVHPPEPPAQEVIQETVAEETPEEVPVPVTEEALANTQQEPIVDTASPPSSPDIRVRTVTQPTRTPRPKGLPAGFEAVHQAKVGAEGERIKGTQIVLAKEDFPWLNKDATPVNLAEVKIAGTGEVFYFGSTIQGKALEDAANQLDERRKRICDSLLYTHMPNLVRNQNSRFSTLINSQASHPILYIGNPSGQRVYVARMEYNNVPTIIRVAVCDKAEQGKVLGTLTNQNARSVKKFGKL